MNSFAIARLPRIEFGRGVFDSLGKIVKQYGQHVLLVTGGKSFRSSPSWSRLTALLADKHIQWEHCIVEGEPSPEFIDAQVRAFSSRSIEVVLGIGGGSVLDAAKAIAGLLQVQHSVMDYLEGVGPELPYEGPALPFIAVPTTAGTGSEATKNAVLSVAGKNGFKKSFRHDRLVAEYAVVDPALLATCPPALIAANGMDALTQLMESYVSTRANVMTDALAISGLHAVREGLLEWYEQGEQAHAAQDKMAYAALLSGITLAQTGLGAVHGLASPLGAFYPISHGVVCGTLVAAATEINIKSMQLRDSKNIALNKYAHVGEVLCNQQHAALADSLTALLNVLRDWTDQLRLPKLNVFGVTTDGLDHIVAHSRGSSMKTNPIVLTDDEIKTILKMRLA